METYISNNLFVNDKGDHDMGKKVLIATLFSPDPVLLSATKLGPDRMILLIDDKPSQQQEDSLKLIQDSLGKVIDVKAIKCSVYDIVKVATKGVEVIDMQPQEDIIYVNITSGRKTKAIGLLFAAYARHDKVKKIAYFTEEENSVIYLPRLSFKLTESQKKILEYLFEGNFVNIKDLADKIKLSPAMAYRAIDELKDMDLVTTEEGLKLTNAGMIARL